MTCNKNVLNIGKFVVGDRRTFVIAEIGNNHNGLVDRALQMVDLAADAGADCVKFQMRHLNEVYRRRSLEKSSEDLGTEYILDLLRRFELTPEAHRKVAQHCENRGILYMCTPWDGLSIDVLEGFGVPGYKVASADLTNLPLLDRLSETGKPLILSTGMSLPEEVTHTVEFLRRRSVQFVLLHCNSTYPAPFHDINLKWMECMRKQHPMIGYSGHERGIAVSLAAVALGACVIERHFTLDRCMEGPDHAASLETDEFRQLIVGIREIEQALGSGRERRISQGEMINRENLGKSLVAARALYSGTVLSAHDIKVLSPGQGLSPQKLDLLIGRKLKRDMGEEDFFFDSDISNSCVAPRSYNFTHPWGIPVRYHDFAEYISRVEPDLVEFHLSYSDMDLDPAEFLSGKYDCGFVVHAPELFSGSHLMDLASPDPEYRARSMAETQRIIDITRALKRYFPRTSKPMIVANIGGFTMDAPLSPDVIPPYYERFDESLGKLNMEGVELIPQTMAPFPWHFGGQRYQNLFLKIEEIVDWCKRRQMRMCFDVSHSKLTCNHLGVDFYEFAERIAPFTAHIHMGDAAGLNGEGLQVGEGEIDFARLGKIFVSACPQASFIPEIWQGHKNAGSGFWIALERLEEVM
jgi:sialic acid synthase SpsE/sugar phosphate isomerase/epimerase